MYKFERIIPPHTPANSPQQSPIALKSHPSQMLVIPPRSHPSQMLVIPPKSQPSQIPRIESQQPPKSQPLQIPKIVSPIPPQLSLQHSPIGSKISPQKSHLKH